MRRLAALLMLVVGLVLSAPAPAHAGDNGAWAVTPTPPEKATPTPRDYFVLEGNPGSVIKDKVRITNFTKKPITFQLYGADAYNTELDGFFALKSADEPQVDLGSWTTLPVTNLTVAPETQVDAPITIRIPENATPGDHVGGIVALNTAVSSTQKQGDVQIGIQNAVGARIYLRVSGPTRAALSVTDVKLTHDRGLLPWTGSGAGTITYTVQNTGNLRQAPKIDIALRGLFGRDVDKATLDGKVDLLPGQKVTLTQKVDGIGHLDHLRASVTVTTSEGATDKADDGGWVVPWLAILVVVLLLAAAIMWWRRRRQAMRRGIEDAQLAPKITVSMPG